MKFKKYQHVERIGTVETTGILDGMCYVFPKIDGTNSSVWLDCHEIKAGSRNRELSFESDNAGFYKAIAEDNRIINFFTNNPNKRLFGEWLVPHSLKTYQDEAWKKFYVFDVMFGDDYLQYDEYKILLDEYEIDYIPPIGKIENPSEEALYNFLEKNIFLIKNNSGIGEGVVIKNYNYTNRFGDIKWAKIVANEFKEKHQKEFKVTEFKEKDFIEKKIVNKYVTKSLCEKEFEKIKNEEGWSSKFIPRLLSVIFYSLIKEESWNFIKENKNSVIDFKRLQGFTTEKIKSELPELF